MLWRKAASPCRRGERTCPLNFAVADAGIYFLSLGDKPETSVLELYDPNRRMRTRLFAIDKEWFYGMALSPDQHQLAYTVVDRQGSGLLSAQYPEWPSP